MIKIHDYKNVRDFLSDYYEQTKARNPKWGLRAWAKKLGIKSPAGLSMILSGKRKIGVQTAKAIVSYFGFDSDESTYFYHLIQFSQASAQGPLISLLQGQVAKAARRKADHSKISDDEKMRFKWWFYAIREMSLLEGFEPTAQWISKRLKHEVPVAEIEVTLASLQRQGFLVRTAQGSLRPAPGHVQVKGSGTASLATAFHQDVLELAQTSLLADAPEDRAFFSSTLTIDKGDLAEAKQVLRDFRLEFDRKFEKKSGSTTVQLNMQLFSVTRD